MAGSRQSVIGGSQQLGRPSLAPSTTSMALDTEDLEGVNRCFGFLLEPESTFVKVHNGVAIFFAFVTCIIVPLQAAFNYEDVGLYVTSYFLDAMFIFSMVMEARTAFEA